MDWFGLIQIILAILLLLLLIALVRIVRQIYRETQAFRRQQHTQNPHRKKHK